MRETGHLDNAPPPLPSERVQSPTLPLPPPRDRSGLDDFLAALSTVEVQNVEDIRVMFAGYEDREAMAGVFQKALAERPCGDVGRFMLLLSAVGELAEPSSLGPLHDLVWTDDADLLTRDPHGGLGSPSDSCCVLPAGGMIQARAAEMFAWIAAGSEDDRLLQIVAEHPSVVTRLAAADAFLFAHADAPVALERVRTIARPEDQNGIGVPRLVRGCDREIFERALAHAQGDREVPIPRRIVIRQRSRGTEAKGAV